MNPSAEPDAAPAPSPRAVRWGPSAWLLRWDGPDSEARESALRRVLTAVQTAPPPGLAEGVGAFSTILLAFQGEAPDPQRLAGWLQGADADVGPEFPPREHVLPVRYDGEDLDEVARHAGLTRAEVVRRHTGSRFRVRCLGFSPGFAYLSGLDPALHIPRRATPRPRIAAGSVAVGGDHAGIYSIPSPGGWNLLGTTSARPFDPNATDPDRAFLFRPGDAVRFVDDPATVAAPFEPPAWTDPVSPWLKVLSPGAFLGVQDGGRPGWRRFGVPPGGWLDPESARAAHRLLGQSEDLPLLEFAGGGQHFEALVDVDLAVCGADARGEVVAPDGSTGPVRAGSLLRLRKGGRLRFRGPSEGVWSHLALRGGIDAPRVLGSAAHNLRAGLGASPRAGSLLAGRAASPADPQRAGRWIDPGRLPGRRTVTVRVHPGPQAALFPPGAIGRFLRGPWTVDPRSDRVGYRLAGEPLPVPARGIESEPVLPGSVQVPPDGRPIVTLPDGPTLGGYPKLAWVDPRDLWRVAQTPPGRPILWEPVGWEPFLESLPGLR